MELEITTPHCLQHDFDLKTYLTDTMRVHQQLGLAFKEDYDFILVNYPHSVRNLIDNARLMFRKDSSSDTVVNLEGVL